jgi:hypothetical protein
MLIAAKAAGKARADPLGSGRRLCLFCVRTWAEQTRSVGLLGESFLGNLREFRKFGVFMNQDRLSRDCGCADPAIGNR